jgi:hypothetical protein
MKNYLTIFPEKEADDSHIGLHRQNEAWTWSDGSQLDFQAEPSSGLFKALVVNTSNSGLLYAELP